MTLRPYQERAVGAAAHALTDRPIIVAPPGAGKTVMGAALATRLGVRTLWLAHRYELIDQAAATLRGLGLRVGLLVGGERPDPRAPIQVGSVQTVVHRELDDIGLVAVDECHRALAPSYRAILGRHADAPRLGLTATPYRLGGRGLGAIFGHIIVAAYMDELVAEGVLIEPTVYGPPPPDTSRVRTRAGEFVEADLARTLDRDRLIADLVATWMARAQGRRTVGFAVNVAHSQRCAERFQAAGIPSEHLDGSMPRRERDAVLARLESGETLVVWNCELLTEGWDLPLLEAAIIARPTQSKGLHVQMVGRVMRAAPGKVDAIVLDHAGNHLRHGFVTERQEYSLADVDRDARNGGDCQLVQPAVRTCPRCYRVADGMPERCIECGFEWSSQAEVPRERAGKLVELDAFSLRADAWLAMVERYGPKMARNKFRMEFGEAPVVAFGELVNPKRATKEQKREVWRQLDEQRQRSRKLDGTPYSRHWTAHRYRAIFGVWPRGVAA